MTATRPDNEAIFHAARDIADPDRRREHVREACGGDEARIGEIAALLAAAEAPDSLLDLPAGSDTCATIDEPTPESAGPLIGPYKLIEQIGEGGMGTVWMAQQTAPVRRLVAIKLIKAGMDSKQVIARFEAERQALALMDHANIARVLDAGTTAGGRPYFVMDLVKGVPITEYCDEHRFTPRQRLELFIPVCQAIQHAHQKGIIHRDLKPTNVLVALYDGKPVPKIIDFGVAKAVGQSLTEKTLVTGFGAIVGTLEYMSPEQAEINQLDIDTRSDIYSLGVLLYELLTGSPPFTKQDLGKAGLLETLRVIREREPPKPSTKLSTAEALPTLAANRGTEPAKLTKLLRGELDWIVMRCLEKDRNRRYETPSALAADVRRYLADEPVHACPPSAVYRFRKLARRNKALFVAASVIALALLVAVATLAASSVLVWQAKNNLQVALERERRDAYFHRITLAHRELVSLDNLGRALELLRGCPQDLCDWEWHYLTRLCRVEPMVLRDRTEVNSVAFCPDGGRLASAGGDGTIKVWNSKTGKVIQTLGVHAASVYAVAFHPDGKHLASVDADRKAKVWDLTTGEMVFDGPSDAAHNIGTAYGVAFCPDGRQLATGSDGAVKVWDWKHRRALRALPGHGKHAISVAFSRDGRLLASGSFLGGLKLWDAERDAPPIRTIAAHRHPVSAVAFSADGGRLASASFDRFVKVWDVTTGELLHSLRHAGIVRCVAFSPDGRRLASGGEDKTVRIWDTTTGREVLGLRGHTDWCASVAFSPDGRRLASASRDGTIRLWDASPAGGNAGQETLIFSRHGEEVWTVAVSPDGRRIASAGYDKLVKVWDPETGKDIVNFRGHDTVVFRLAWQPDGRRIASAGWADGSFTVKVWDAKTCEGAFALPGGPEYNAVAYSPDGGSLVTGRHTGALQIWDGHTGRGIGTLSTQGRPIRGVVFSRDGRHLAAASDDGVVKLWDATRLEEQKTARHSFLVRVPGAGLNIAFSPDGRRLATGGLDNTVKIWDVETFEELKTLRGHSGEVYTLAFSPKDGRWIASGGEDSTVKIWDSQTGTIVHSFRGHTALVSSVAFSPDDRRLFSGSRDKTVRVWDVSQLSDEARDP
jgi:WD40 repeat protein/serine/threonine protein kinase